MFLSLKFANLIRVPSKTSETFNSEPFSQTESTWGEIKSNQVSVPFWASKLIEATQEYVSPTPSIVNATV